MIHYKMFGLIKKAFFVGLTYLASVNSLSCISMTNWEFKVRPEIVNVISNEPVFYPFCIKTSKCGGRCNNINDPYAKIGIPDAEKI